MSSLNKLVVKILCIFSIKAQQYLTDQYFLFFSKDEKYQEEICIAMGHIFLKIVHKDDTFIVSISSLDLKTQTYSK